MSDPIDILLVENNIDDAELTIRELKRNKMGNKLVHVQDGEEALEYIFATGKFADRNISHTPKLILLDIQMPKVDGIEVLQNIKSDNRTKGIPVVMLTSSNQDPDIKKCYNLGANSYIVKPVNFESFAKAISDLGMYWVILNQQPPVKTDPK